MMLGPFILGFLCIGCIFMNLMLRKFYLSTLISSFSSAPKQTKPNFENVQNYPKDHFLYFFYNCPHFSKSSNFLLLHRILSQISFISFLLIIASRYQILNELCLLFSFFQRHFHCFFLLLLLAFSSCFDSCLSMYAFCFIIFLCFIWYRLSLVFNWFKSSNCFERLLLLSLKILLSSDLIF